MNKRYHASASQTLAAIQSLYEDKLLSYPRTDCAYITDEEFEYLVANLTKYLGLVSKPVALTNTTPNKRYVNGKKVEEHYAIIMTKVVPTKEKLASLPKLQQQVYDLVLRTTLAMFADPYEYEETTIITQVGDANFKATGKVPTSKVGKLYLMITKPISKKQPPYRSFTKATRLKQIYKRRKKKRPHQYRLPKGH